jgi:hypothetical protein
MIRGRLHFSLICLCVIVLLVTVAHADMVPPKITYVYFTMGDIPYNGTVNYTVTCYGYPTDYRHITLAPGSYQPQPVYQYSESYTGYGTPSYQQSYLQYTHIDRCELEGVADNGNFTIRNLSSNYFSRADVLLERVPRDVGGFQKYYFVTPEFSSCRNFGQNEQSQWTAESLNFSRINSTTRQTAVLQLPGRILLYGILPWHHVPINRSDISTDLDGYIAYLETCRVNADPACPGWIADGKPLKTFPGYRTLNQNASYIKEHPCDTFLLEADPSLIMPITDMEISGHRCYSNDKFAPCNLTESLYEARFTIPPSVSPDRHRRPVEALYCTILSWFNASCE